MKLPDDVKRYLTRRYQNQHRDWLAGVGTWPLTVSLDCPTEREAQRQLSATRAWVAAWQNFRGPGDIQTCERRWPSLGTQQLPDRLILHNPDDVASWTNEETRWRRACTRYQHLIARWPALSTHLPRHFDSLADYDDPDFERLETLIAWLEANPHSGLYPRQLPVPGLDSKWLELRKTLVAQLLSALRNIPIDATDFYRSCGLRTLPQTVHALILDPALRSRVGGLRYIVAPLDELAATSLDVRRIYIVENLQTGLAFDDLPNSVVFMRLGYGVTQLARIPWIPQAECVYWGDLDTHGFAILDLARSCLPRVTSLLMDEDTLLKYRPLWGNEKEQSRAEHLPRLTSGEHALFDALKSQRWAENLRLEQERIDWRDAWQQLSDFAPS